MLLGSAEDIKRARRIRKVLGGGMRQAGFLAAAGIYALDNHIGRLSEDHERAKKLALALRDKAYVEKVLPVDTNIVIFTLSNSKLAADFVNKLREVGILAVTFGKHDVRFVTHLDFDDQQLEKCIDILNKL